MSEQTYEQRVRDLGPVFAGNISVIGTVSRHVAASIAAEADARIAELEAVVERLLALFVGEGETSNEAFERVNRLFYDATGMMRPGKDDPTCAHSYDERQDAFIEWRNGITKAALAVLAEREATA